eukprot:TRINITY_DN19215_c0_g1_i2.p1 TRINITY_DN19215_c0_g1~~TRINITY_DN19215_c0_g1_i2.p1  ORF type:complete len:951 (-),score=292.97 TRINITY_DN19215_c0_g1_i2:69-2921(-)
MTVASGLQALLVLVAAAPVRKKNALLFVAFLLAIHLVSLPHVSALRLDEEELDWHEVPYRDEEWTPGASKDGQVQLPALFAQEAALDRRHSETKQQASPQLLKKYEAAILAELGDHDEGKVLLQQSSALGQTAATLAAAKKGSQDEGLGDQVPGTSGEATTEPPALMALLHDVDRAGFVSSVRRLEPQEKLPWHVLPAAASPGSGKGSTGRSEAVATAMALREEAARLQHQADAQRESNGELRRPIAGGALGQQTTSHGPVAHAIGFASKAAAASTSGHRQGDDLVKPPLQIGKAARLSARGLPAKKTVGRSLSGSKAESKRRAAAKFHLHSLLHHGMVEAIDSRSQSRHGGGHHAASRQGHHRAAGHQETRVLAPDDSNRTAMMADLRSELDPFSDSAVHAASPASADTQAPVSNTPPQPQPKGEEKCEDEHVDIAAEAAKEREQAVQAKAARDQAAAAGVALQKAQRHSAKAAKMEALAHEAAKAAQAEEAKKLQKMQADAATHQAEAAEAQKQAQLAAQKPKEGHYEAAVAYDRAKTLTQQAEMTKTIAEAQQKIVEAKQKEAEAQMIVKNSQEALAKHTGSEESDEQDLGLSKDALEVSRVGPQDVSALEQFFQTRMARATNAKAELERLTAEAADAASKAQTKEEEEVAEERSKKAGLALQRWKLESANAQLAKARLDLAISLAAAAAPATPPSTETTATPGAFDKQAPAVSLSMKLENVNFDLLAADQQLHADFVKTLQTAMAAESGVSREDVQPTLSPGSVRVKATVTLGDSAKATSVQSKLADSAALGKAVSSQIKAMPGIGKVSTGPIEATEITKPVPEASAPTTLTTTTSPAVSSSTTSGTVASTQAATTLAPVEAPTPYPTLEPPAVAGGGGPAGSEQLSPAAESPVDKAKKAADTVRHADYSHLEGGPLTGITWKSLLIVLGCCCCCCCTRGCCWKVN